MILACDPGVTGAFAKYDGAILRIADMPTVTERAGKRNTERRFLDRPLIIRILRNAHMLDGIDVLVMELVGGIPGQAAHGAFTFGHGAGGITYAAEALGMRVVEVPAVRWKGAMKCPADKRAAIERASAIFPEHADKWAGVRGNGSEAQRSGRAEAALLAKYGWQTEGMLA